METPGEDHGAHLADLSAYIADSPSPFHAVANATALLAAAGFERLVEADPWAVGGGRFFVERDGALIAWSTEHASPRDGFHIVGAHTDSPNLRLRPRPDHRGISMAQLGVEVYGGALLNSWLDRELGLSGRVSLRSGEGLVETRLVRFDEPLLRIPQLAIHLDRTVNADGLRLDPQRHIQPVWSTAVDSVPQFRTWLASRMQVDDASILSWEVMVHDLTAPAVLGVDRSMFAAPRIDNLLSCHSALRALAAASQERTTAVPMICLFDHEEVGSQTASGAAGQFLPATLERIATAEGLSGDEYLTAVRRSFCVSADGAHATHPNYPERHEPDHLVFLDHGPVLKWNADARYATSAPTAAYIRNLAREREIPLQDFISRNDMPCGSTIGPVTAARLGIPTVDVGVAQLSMHSARELTGVLDPGRFSGLLHAFLTDHSPSRR